MIDISKWQEKKQFFKKLSFIGGFFLILGLMLVYLGDPVNLARSSGVISGCQLTMNQTDNGPVQPGSNAIYHITLANTGTANCTQSRLRYVFDQKTSFVSATMVYEDKTPAFIVWFFDTLSPAESKTIDLTMKVSDTVPNNSVLSNSLQSCSTENLCSDFITKQTQVASNCQLTMTKTDNGPVLPGGNIIYHLTLKNTGTTNCTESRLRDVFDQNTSYVSATISFEEKTAAFIVWNFKTLSPDQSQAVDLTMKVSGSVQCDSTLSNSLQSCSTEVLCSNFITKQTQLICCASDQDCSDGLFCNGQETCVNHKCQPGAPVSCSINDLTGINTCTNIPDDNPYTFDTRTPYVSQCSESSKSCTIGDNTIGHVCDVTRCQAECDATHACADTICHTKNGCVGHDLYTYQDAANSCQAGCSCTANACPAPQISVNDPACTPCQKDADCHSLDQTFCDGTVVKQTTGRCVNFSCVANTVTVKDCNDGLTCNGLETCSQATCHASTPVDCSANNISAVESCSYIPDNNPFTLDRRALFTSTCQEPTGTCAIGDSAINHFCSTQCGGCAVDADCNDQNSNTIDTCNTGFGTGVSVCRCQHSPISGQICGNGIKEGTEQCDGTDGVGAHQTCSSTCALITAPFCGDGVKNGAEQCDGTDGAGAHQTCSSTCTLSNAPFCGDDVCNNQETCSTCPADCGGCGGGHSGGGGGGGGAVPLLDLTFNNLNAVSNLCSTALVRWSTSQFASSRILFDAVSHSNLTNLSSPNYGYASSTVLDATPVTGHSVTITGLTPSATYYFRPVSTAAREKFGNEISVTVNANCAVSPAPVKIITPPPPPPPQVLGVKIMGKPSKHPLKRTGFSLPEFELLGGTILLLIGISAVLRKYPEPDL